ncbi:MAG: TraX family protein [Erysipelotrichaceae bacterium]|nr:TraX family protein [Erysipelotrichaceae bacterium]
MKKFLTSFDLKIIAIATMTLDHVGFYLFPQIEWLRIIGRIAFPLFAFLSAESYRYTHNKKAYASRMVVLGLLFSAVRLTVDPTSGADIFLTLGLGFCVLWGMDEKQYWFSLLAFLFGVFVLPVDYSWYGIIMVPFFYYSIDKPWIQLAGMCLLNVAFVMWGNAHVIQYASIVALLFIVCYNHQLGYRKGKYIFYFYYPLHVMVLYGLSFLL